MLSNVLEGKTCAECRICCSFVRDDVWEAPVFSKKEVALAIAHGVSADAFEEWEDGCYRGKYIFHSDTEILLCPCLDEKKGCVLGKEKPFECSIWPLRIVELENEVTLALAELCPAFDGEKKEILLKELEDGGLRDKILQRKGELTKIKSVEEGYMVL